MTFLQKSPAQELREHFRHDPRQRPRFAGSWQTIGDGTPLRCGLCVYDIADERHVGRIVSYDRGHATVRWFESGWLSEGHSYRNLRQAPNF
jgi:hypothetical protein